MNFSKSFKIFGGVVVILLIPFVLTAINPNSQLRGGLGGGWDWAPGDFVVMGGLLFVFGWLLDFVLRRFQGFWARFFASLAVVFACLLVWVELAVDAVSTFLRSLF